MCSCGLQYGLIRDESFTTLPYLQMPTNLIQQHNAEKIETYRDMFVFCCIHASSLSCGVQAICSVRKAMKRSISVSLKKWVENSLPHQHSKRYLDEWYRE